MRIEYYAFPLQAGLLMQKKEHPRSALEQSIVQHLHLIITTAFGEFPCDESFGSGIWDHDFDNLTSGARLKEILRQSLLQSVNRHEKRLVNIRVDLMVHQEELVESASGRRVKKRMDVTVTGLLQLTNEQFMYKDHFFIGPLSY